MQALIALSLIALYLLDQTLGRREIENAAWRTAAIPAAMLVGPILLLAIGGASRCFRRGWIPDPVRLQRLTVAAWFSSGILLIAGLNWGSILRNQLRLREWSPLDELVLFATLCAALPLSWAAEYFVAERMDLLATRTVRSLVRTVAGFVVFRARIFLLPAVAPFALVLMAQSLGEWIAATVGAPSAETWIKLALLMICLAILPWIFSLLWGTNPLPDGSLRTLLEATLAARRVNFADIRIWPTGNQMTNALVVGLFPRLRYLILTDRLIALLSPSEIGGVAAHEAGHVRRGHLIDRIWYIILPIVAIASLQWAVRRGGEPTAVDWLLGWMGETNLWAASVLIYIGYAFGIMAWLSRNMEHQADVFACQSVGADGCRQVDAGATEIFCQSLIKLAADSGEDITRSSWLHPSIDRRIRFLLLVALQPSTAQLFEIGFGRKKLALTVAICAMALGLATS